MTQSQLPAASKLIGNADRFGLENGAGLLGRHFRDVHMWRYEDSLAIPAVEPIVDYAASVQLPDTPEMHTHLEELAALLSAELAMHGRIRIDKETGLFEAKGPRLQSDAM
jgi:hypothetical protein